MNSLNRVVFAIAAALGLSACGTAPRNPVEDGPSLSVPVQANSCSGNGIDARHINNLQRTDVIIEAQKYGRSPHFHRGFYILNVNGVKDSSPSVIGTLFGLASGYALTRDASSAFRALGIIGGGIAGNAGGNLSSERDVVNSLLKIDACKTYLDGLADKDLDARTGKPKEYRAFNIDAELQQLQVIQPRPNSNIPQRGYGTSNPFPFILQHIIR